MHADSGRSGSRNHSADCRQRVEGLLAQDDDGRRRLPEANARRDVWTAEKVEDNVANSEVVELQEMPKKEAEVFEHQN